jgi:hypothetical protein
MTCFLARFAKPLRQTRLRRASYRIPGESSDRIHSFVRWLMSGGVAYSRSTLNLRSASKSRRWRLAIAAVAALSMFVAVTTGWALRSAHGIAAPPEPAAWSHATLNVSLHVDRAQFAVSSQPTSHGVLRSSQGSSPTHHKPTKNAWMTHDRPPTWAHVAPQLAWSPWPVILPPWETAWAPPPGSQSGSGAPAAVIAGRDILTQLCVARR